MKGKSKDFKANFSQNFVTIKHEIPGGCYKNHQWSCNSYESIINALNNVLINVSYSSHDSNQISAEIFNRKNAQKSNSQKWRMATA
jgi:hypothetical protein